MKIMGIINLTPDSFYSSSRFDSTYSINHKINEFVNEGADIIDVGAESSRPGSIPISEEEELNRLKPIFSIIKKYTQTKFSIDTYKSNVADVCLNNGFHYVNDIYSGKKDNKIFSIVKRYNAKIVLMHMRGNPKNMQIDTVYNDVLKDINLFFAERIKIALENGVKLSNIIIDPGIGFGKSKNDNFKIINNLSFFKKHNLPILVGHSRKSFLSLNSNQPKDRLIATIVATTIALQNGCDIIRVHDINETKHCIDIYKKFMKYN